MRFTGQEIKELAISAVVIGFSFAWIMKGSKDFIEYSFTVVFAIMLGAVGFGFIFHELSHKYSAQKYGCWAEYRMWETGLIIAFLLAVSPLRMVFAAPGAVYISPGMHGITRRQNGIISVSGAVANLTLALLFLFLIPFGGAIGLLGKSGVLVNAWLALFNMLPFPPLDGSKVRAWDTKVWIGVILAALVMMNLA